MKTMSLPRPGTILTGTLVALLAFVVFGPLLNMLMWTVAEVWYFPAKLPQEWGFAFWQRVFRPEAKAVESLANSVFIALVTVVTSLLVAIPAGLALARRDLPLRAAFLLLFLLPQAFPSLAVHMNMARIFYGLGLNGTIAGVVLAHTLQGMVFAVWIAAAAFGAISPELVAAARNLGAGPWRAFRTITLPLALPG